jgi:hypothetical protein
VRPGLPLSARHRARSSHEQREEEARGARSINTLVESARKYGVLDTSAAQWRLTRCHGLLGVPRRQGQLRIPWSWLRAFDGCVPRRDRLSARAAKSAGRWWRIGDRQPPAVDKRCWRPKQDLPGRGGGRPDLSGAARKRTCVTLPHRGNTFVPVHGSSGWEWPSG